MSDEPQNLDDDLSGEISGTLDGAPELSDESSLLESLENFGQVTQDYFSHNSTMERLKTEYGDFSLLSEVFGVNVDVPRNYTPRSEVDDALAAAIARRQHVVIHGSSKQGKTCLRKRYFSNNDNYVALTCISGWTLSDLHLQILKSAGHRQHRQDVITTGSNRKTSGKLGGRLRLGPAVELSAEASNERDHSNQFQRTVENLGLDPTDANDVISALRSLNFEKVIVLEDFHYLSPATQQEFSVALKAYHDSGQIQFIIVGVWLDRNRLIQYNGDLSGRIESINVDNWPDHVLRDVIQTGAEILGIDFDLDFCIQLIRLSKNSVWIVQEVCYRACQRAGVLGDQSQRRVLVGQNYDVQSAVAEIVSAMNSRFLKLVSNIAIGGRSKADLHRWIIGAVLVSDTDQLAGGIRRLDLREFINKNRPGQPVEERTLSRALNSLTKLQAKGGINPIVLDYDQGNSQLNVVDRSFLIWLDFIKEDMRSVLEEAHLPTTLISATQKDTRTIGKHRRSPY